MYEQAFISYYFFSSNLSICLCISSVGGEDNPDPEIHVIVQEGNSYRLDALYRVLRTRLVIVVHEHRIFFLFFQVCVGRTGPIIVSPDDDDEHQWACTP
jgi:hypothetical protein